MLKLSRQMIFCLILFVSTLVLYVLLSVGLSGLVIPMCPPNMMVNCSRCRTNNTNGSDMTNSGPLPKTHNETLYDVQGNDTFVNTLKLRPEDLSATFVLLVTYARSGSSWLGELTNQANDSFYVFEPLHGTIQEGYFTKNLVCFNNNTCREPRTILERHTTALSILHKLFTCRISKLHPYFIGSIKHKLRSRKPQIMLEKCSKSKISGKCLKTLDTICAKASYRIIKTIRLSITLLSELIGQWPNLKVINLIRDQRAITYSRQRPGSGFTMADSLIPHSIDLCSRMHDDLVLTRKLQKHFPNRMQILLYEALASRPFEGTKYVYEFLKMDFSEHVSLWVNKTAHSNRTGSPEYFGVVRRDPEYVASKWRLFMYILPVQVIDYICRDVYRLSGYIPMNTTKQLRSMKIPSRRLTELNGFV